MDDDDVINEYAPKYKDITVTHMTPSFNRIKRPTADRLINERAINRCSTLKRAPILDTNENIKICNAIAREMINSFAMKRKREESMDYSDSDTSDSTSDSDDDAMDIYVDDDSDSDDAANNDTAMMRQIMIQQMMQQMMRQIMIQIVVMMIYIF
jgi:hypothetical protein